MTRTVLVFRIDDGLSDTPNRPTTAMLHEVSSRSSQAARALLVLGIFELVIAIAALTS